MPLNFFGNIDDVTNMIVFLAFKRELTKNAAN